MAAKNQTRNKMKYKIEVYVTGSIQQLLYKKIFGPNMLRMRVHIEPRLCYKSSTVH